ncbi:unnamed protein product, partial [Strongylus vulgaris]
MDDRRCDSLMVLMGNLKLMKFRPTYILLENVVGFETSSVHDAIILWVSTQECILSPLQFGIPNSRPRYYLMASTHFPVVGLAEDIADQFRPNSSSELKEISEFLCEPSHTSSLYLDENVLQKYGCAIDVILPSSTRSACFTKSYGSYISGCGSYICYRPDLVVNNHLNQSTLDDAQSLRDVVRRLSPREVANLMCFPKTFEIPPELS